MLTRSLTYKEYDWKFKAFGCMYGTESDCVAFALGSHVIWTEEGCIVDKSLQRAYAFHSCLWLRSVLQQLLILPGIQ